MLNTDNIDCRVISLAESVRGELLYDLKFKITPVELFCTEFAQEIVERERFCKNVYKYNK